MARRSANLEKNIAPAPEGYCLTCPTGEYHSQAELLGFDFVANLVPAQFLGSSWD